MNGGGGEKRKRSDKSNDESRGMKKEKRAYDPNYVPKRPKPFQSKQNRGVTGKKQKPGKPSEIKVVHGPQQFYWAPYVFTTKKELRDRIKHILLVLAGASTRPLVPGGLKNEMKGGLAHKKTEEEELKFERQENLPNLVKSLSGEEVVLEGGLEQWSQKSEEGELIILLDSEMGQFLDKLTRRHPNWPNWSNKCIEKWKVTRADSRKAPPVLWGTFKGNPNKWRNLDWMKCVYKTDPTPDDKLYSAMWNAISPLLKTTPEGAERPSPDMLARKKSLPCSRCGLDRLHIDGVRPSHVKNYGNLVAGFLENVRGSGLGDLIPNGNHLEWRVSQNAFSFRPCDTQFEEMWRHYHAHHCPLALLCETCRVEKWMRGVPPPQTPHEGRAAPSNPLPLIYADTHCFIRSAQSSSDTR